MDTGNSLLSLLRTRRFAPLFIAQALGAFNDNVFRNAAIILATYALAQQGWNAGLLVGLAGALFILPFFLFSGIAGELADTRDKAALARTIKLAEIGIAALAALSLWLAWPPLMLAVLFLAGTQSTFFGPIKYAILPQHLADNELLPANAWIETSTFIAILLGTLLGGLGIASNHGVATLTLVMLATATLGWLAARRIPPAPAPRPRDQADLNPITSTVGILRDLFAHPRLLRAAIYISWFWALGLVILGLMPLLARSVLNGNETVANMFIALFTVGIALGAWLAQRLLHGAISMRLAPLAALLLALALLDLTLAVRGMAPAAEEAAGNAAMLSASALLSSFSGWRLTLDVLLIATFGGLFIVPIYAWLQHHAPDDMRARIIAANNVLNALFMAVASTAMAMALYKGAAVSGILAILMLLQGLLAAYLIWRRPQDFLRSVGTLLFRLFYRVEVKGLKHLEEAGSRAVIISNHVSWLDGQMLATFLPRDTAFAVHSAELEKPLARLMGKVFHLLPLDPANPMALRTLIHAVENDRHVVIFPEGRISTTGGLMKIYEGPGVIAHKAEAPIVPIFIRGAERARFFSRQPHRQRLKLFPKITITIQPPVRMDAPDGLRGPKLRNHLANRLYDVMAEAAFRSTPWRRHLMEAVIDVRRDHGGKRKVLEDIQRTPLAMNRLLAGCYILGGKLAALTPGEKTVGVLLPTSAGCLVTLLGLLARGRTPAMMNFSTGVVNMIAACKAAQVKTIVTSRRFIEQGGLENMVQGLAEHARIIWLEDVRETISLKDKLAGLGLVKLGRAGLKMAGANMDADDAAVILFTSGSEGVPKGVVLTHANVLANAYQVLSIIDLNPADRVFNALPMFHALGLSAGVFLPLVAGARLFLYPSPLHYKIIPELVYDTDATVFFATDTFLNGYARNAHPYDFYNVRYVVAGAEKVKDSTRAEWMDKFGLRIFEGYGATETSPVLSVNTPMHFRSGSVGRLLPEVEHRIEPVEGIDEGGRLVVKGPNVMKGYLRADTPGEIEPPADGWYDTGDIVSIDEQGFVFIQGRAKRFAKIAGEMVSLTAVENIVSSAFPDAAHAVASVPDKKKGEQLVLATTDAQLDRRKVAKALKEAGAPELFAPRHVLHVEEIPVLGSGKTDYVTLQRLVNEKFASE